MIDPLTASAIGGLVSAVAGAVIQSATDDNALIGYAAQSAIDKGLNGVFSHVAWKNNYQRMTHNLAQQNQLMQTKLQQNYFSNTFN